MGCVLTNMMNHEHISFWPYASCCYLQSINGGPIRQMHYSQMYTAKVLSADPLMMVHLCPNQLCVPVSLLGQPYIGDAIRVQQPVSVFQHLQGAQGRDDTLSQMSGRCVRTPHLLCGTGPRQGSKVLVEHVTGRKLAM